MHEDRGPVALVVALAVEAKALIPLLGRSKLGPDQMELYEGFIEGHAAVLTICGIGKVAAAMATQLLCDARHPRAVISIGIAGGTGTRARGHVIVASGAVQHDFDARPLTSERGQIPGFAGRVFPADRKLTAALLVAARAEVDDPAEVQAGVVLTGDRIIASTSVRDSLLEEFPGAACFDMETAAVAQVAGRNGVPWAALRITSDSADETFALEDAYAFGAGPAADLFERVIRGLMRSLPL
jgi:adenosylhomocysteine nucleosidase